MTQPAALGRTAGKILAWIAVVLLVLCAALAIFLVTFDWNRARPWVDDKVSQAIGRPFAINGDLRVGWQHPAGEHGWRAWVPWPRFSAYDITIGNPPWAATMTFARLDEISFDVEVLPLLAHVISIPSIDLVNPSIDLERLKDGRANWTFNLPKSNGPSRWTLRLADLSLAKARIALSDELEQANFHVEVGTLGQPLPIGEVGELMVKGPQVMQGYWNRPEAAASAFIEREDGRWLRTGDVATLDEDGYISIVDRIKDMITVGGFKVFPSQVEQVLLRHPSVKEVLVIGMPDEYHGELPAAFVTLQDDSPKPDAATLLKWANAHLGKHERLKSVEIRASLPKTAIGKLDRKTLRAEVLGHIEADCTRSARLKAG